MSNYSSSAVFKEAPDGLIAHVYEHLASSYLIASGLESGLKSVADFSVWGHTYGAVMYIEFDCYSDEASATLRKKLNEFSASEITVECVHKAAKQVAIEMNRPLLECTEEFTEAIGSLHKTAWRNFDEFPVFQASIHTSVNTVFKSVGILLGDEADERFVERTIHLEVDTSSYSDEPARKALAVLTVQTLALNIHALLEEEVVCYDRGDAWDAAGDQVMYRTTLGFAHDTAPSAEWFNQKIETYLNLLKKSDLSVRFVHLLGESYKNQDALYFTLADMNRITDGIIIGSAGWQAVANEEVVLEVLDKVIAGEAEYF